LVRKAEEMKEKRRLCQKKIITFNSRHNRTSSEKNRSNSTLRRQFSKSKRSSDSHTSFRKKSESRSVSNSSGPNIIDLKNLSESSSCGDKKAILCPILSMATSEKTINKYADEEILHL
jgi:hypothetical protein